MLFNSLEFLIFLPIVFALYWFVFNRSLKWQNGLVLVASYFFYGWWSWKFMILLMASTLLDYTYGFWVASPNRTKARFFMWLGVINNLGMLGIFKYYNFFATELQHALGGVGIQVTPVLLKIALPVGISFYTFHGMSYVFDIYRGHQKPIRNFIEYAVFVCFFPLLVAGPIERASHLLPQVQRARKFDYAKAVEGCRLILWGMFKKVVIADSLSIVVDRIFNNYHDYSTSALIAGAIAFSFQIYGDFSGYSDIALGTAKLFGFELLSNFKFPYLSRDIAEFWRRWHISLSSWFRDYLYIPLGGSRDGKSKAIRNTFIIFLVSGFWHGASWNFIVWGGIHACGFLPLLLIGQNRKNVSSVVAQDAGLPTFKELYQMLATFTFVTFAWIFFRANSLGNAVGYIKQIGVSALRHQQLMHVQIGNLFVYILPIIVGDWLFRRNERQLIFFKNRYLRVAVYLLLTMCVIMKLKANNSFIYFQF